MVEINYNSLIFDVPHQNKIFRFCLFLWLGTCNSWSPGRYLAVTGFVLIYDPIPKPPLCPANVSHTNKPLSQRNFHLLAYLDSLSTKFRLEVIDLGF
jgi:hypothetical protein